MKNTQLQGNFKSPIHGNTIFSNPILEIGDILDVPKEKVCFPEAIFIQNGILYSLGSFKYEYDITWDDQEILDHLEISIETLRIP